MARAFLPISLAYFKVLCGLNSYYKDFLHVALFLILTPVAVRSDLEVLEDVNIGVLPEASVAR